MADIKSYSLSRPHRLNNRFIRLQKLTKAVRKNNLAEAKCLIETGVTVNSTSGGITPLHVAAAHNHVECAELLLNNGAKHTLTISPSMSCPLHVACRFNSLACVVLLINRGADVNAVNGEGWAPLFLAVRSGYTKCTEVLVTSGALVDMKLQPPGQERPREAEEGTDGLVPLHFAARHGQLECIKVLLAHGANVNATASTSRLTPLHMAVCRSNHASCVHQLAAHAADVNMSDRFGNTPLHIASRKGYVESVEILLQAGASPYALNKDDKRPFDLAMGPVKPFLESYLGQPRTLLFTCILAIRKALHRTRLEQSVAQLPLPGHIQAKVMLQNSIRLF